MYPEADLVGIVFLRQGRKEGCTVPEAKGPRGSLLNLTDTRKGTEVEVTWALVGEIMTVHLRKGMEA